MIRIEYDKLLEPGFYEILRLWVTSPDVQGNLEPLIMAVVADEPEVLVAVANRYFEIIPDAINDGAVVEVPKDITKPPIIHYTEGQRLIFQNTQNLPREIDLEVDEILQMTPTCSMGTISGYHAGNLEYVR